MCGDRATAGGYVQFLIIAGLDYKHVDVFLSWSAALDCSVVPHKATMMAFRAVLGYVRGFVRRNANRGRCRGDPEQLIDQRRPAPSMPPSMSSIDPAADCPAPPPAAPPPSIEFSMSLSGLPDPPPAPPNGLFWLPA